MLGDRLLREEPPERREVVGAPGGVSQQQIDEMRAALRELGLEDQVEIDQKVDR